MARRFAQTVATATLSTAMMVVGPALPEQAPSAWTPFIPLSASDLLDRHPEWVSTEDDAGCFIDMRHTLTGQKVTALRGRVDNTACRKGDEIRPGQLPDNYNDILEIRRRNWGSFLSVTRALIGQGRDEALFGAKDPWAKRIGHKDSQGVQLHDGSDGVYGPDDCALTPAEAGPDILPIYLARLGNLAFRDKAYDLVEVMSNDSDQVKCRLGDILLIETGPVYSI